ncbi:hypothetical protein SLS53_004839 [Cytospora paraplurivora]|uniref:Uncharacterized protein n=1 Tax=Cytospora paraplurivora TaxID=2898453 RepID=A0AAN9YFU6_9PEZI
MAEPSSRLEVSGAPVVVEWVDNYGRQRYLHDTRKDSSASIEARGGVSCDMVFDASLNSLSFKLRASFVTTLRPKEVTPIYLVVPPERVTTLSAESSDDVPKTVSEQLSTDAIRLQFILNRPADLIVPVDDLAPKNKAYGEHLWHMSSLSRLTTITLYVAGLSEEQIRPLCNAVSSGGVRSIEKHADLSAMYHGRGGRVYTDADALVLTQARSSDDSGQAGPSGVQGQERTSKASEENLPPYPPPLPPASAEPNDAGTSKKRRRSSPSAETAEDQCRALKRLVVEMFGGLGQEIRAIKEELRETKEEVCAIKEELRETKEEVCAIKEELRETKEEVCAIKEELRETKEEVCAIKEELRETKQELHETEQELHETEQELRAVHDELPQVRDSCVQYVDRHIADAREDMDQQISGILNEADAHIGLQLDEELTTAKVELQDFITDGLRGTAADIVQRLRDAEVYLDIRFESP